MPRPAATGSDFAERLDLALKALNLSRAQLASQVGVDKSLVSRWLSGGMRPTGHNLARISEVLARARPGFNILMWERPREEFDAFLGIEGAPAPQPSPAEPEPPAQAAAAPAGASPVVRRRWVWAAAAAIAVLVLGGGLAVAFWPKAPAPAPAAPAAALRTASIAVLPFVNLSGDPARDYFSDGFSEELLNALSNTPGLSVASRTDSFAFRSGKSGTPEIGRKLGVRHVLEGSVREEQRRIRVSVQLVDTVTGYQLWSQVYDRDLTDVLKVQDEIARAIAAQLTHRLLPAARARTIDPDVYRSYLQAIRYVEAYTPESTERAIALFAEVTRRQPDFADGFASLGVAYINLAEEDRRRTDERRLGEEALKKALALDPNQTRALTFMVGLSVREWRWAEAMDYQRRLEATNGPPGSKAEGRAQVADALGLPGEVRAAAALSVARTPDDAMLRYNYAWALGATGDHAKALDQTREALALAPNSNQHLGLQCYELAMLGRLAEARAVEARLREAYRDRPIAEHFSMCTAAIAHRTGDLAALRALAERMAREFPGEGTVEARAIGFYFQQALDFDDALFWYGRARERREYSLMQVPLSRPEMLSPGARRMFDDPRWKALMADPAVQAWARARADFARRHR